MAFEPKDNSGVLFKNDKREKDTHPHATGTALIDGVEYWVSAWTKEGRNGKFQSLSFKRKEARREQSAQHQRSYAESSGGTAAAIDDDLPF